MKRLTIAFDIDGVLRDLVGGTLSKMVPKEDPNQITTYGGFVKLFPTKNSWREFLDLTRSWEESPVHPVFVDLFHRFQEDDLFHPIIVTSNSRFEGQSQTLSWLKREVGDGLDIHFVNQKTRVEFDAIIEDCPGNAYDAAIDGRLGFLVDRPWTREDVPPRGDWRRRLIVLPEDDKATEIILQELAFWRRFGMGRVKS